MGGGVCLFGFFFLGNQNQTQPGRSEVLSIWCTHTPPVNSDHCAAARRQVVLLMQEPQGVIHVAETRDFEFDREERLVGSVGHVAPVFSCSGLKIVFSDVAEKR